MTARNTPVRTARHLDGAAGFTLVELIVVTVVLALLACMLMPVVTSSRRQAQRTACAGHLRQLGHSYHLYADAHKGQYPLPTSPGMWPVGNLGGLPGAETEPRATALLFVTGHLTEPRVGYCPDTPVGAAMSYASHEKHWTAGKNRTAKVKWNEVYSGYVLYAGWHANIPPDAPNYDLIAQAANDTAGKVMATDIMVSQPNDWNNHPTAAAAKQPAQPRQPGAGGEAPLPFLGGNVLLNDGSVEWRDSRETKLRFGRDRFGFDRDFYF